MAAIPTIGEEDAKRPNRERESLVGERTRLINRMKATLARFGIRTFKPTLRKAEEKLADLRTAEETSLPENTLAELRRSMTRGSVPRRAMRSRTISRRVSCSWRAGNSSFISGQVLHPNGGTAVGS